MPLFGPPNIEKLKEKRDVTGLLKALDHRDTATRLNAEHALNELGTEIAEPLARAALSAWTAKVRHAATEELRKLGKAAVEPIITQAIQEEEEHPIGAMELFGDLGELQSEIVETLIARLKGDDEMVRLWAVLALGMMDDERAVQALVAALEDDDDNVREAAEAALESIEDPNAEEALARYRERKS